MAQLANVLVDPSVYPERGREILLQSLRSRRIAPRLHYESYKQASHWLRLHEACSPARTDPDCFRVYEQAFAQSAAYILNSCGVPATHRPALHVVGLGAGGGQKEATLLKLLQPKGLELFYTPTDVSLGLVLTARTAALDCVPGEACCPLLIDLAGSTDLAGALQAAGPVWASSAPRLVTLFGILPNFEPAAVQHLLTQAVRPRDLILLSANLSPGPDYDSGLQAVLPLYDNELTRQWLMLLPLDLGIEPQDGAIRFGIEKSSSPGLSQIVADFVFARERRLRIHDEAFCFAPGEQLRLFYSNRHTVALVQGILQQCGLDLLCSWTNRSGEEGVFLALRR